MTMRFLGIPVAFQNTASIMGHGSVAATLGDYQLAIAAGVHLGIEIIIVQKSVQGHGAVKELHLWFGRSEEEPGGIQRLGIEIRENGADQLFQVAVFLRFLHWINRKQHMELRPGCLTAFYLHVVAAVMNCKGYAWEGIGDIRWIFPIIRVIRVVIVTVHWKAVAAEKIGVVSVTPCVLRTHIVMGDSLFQSGLIYNIDLVRIQTVSRLPHTVRMVNGKHQS